MKPIRSGFACLACLVLATGFVQAQKKIDQVRLSLWFGTREISCKQYPATENLDFMDYVDANLDYPEDDYLGLATRFKFSEKWQADIRFTVDSGWDPSSFNCKIGYYPVRQLGLSAGVFGYPHYIEHFDLYHTTRDIEFYTDIRNNTDYKQRLVSDIGVLAGIVLPLDFRFLHARLQLHGGVSSFTPFKEVFGQKAIHSNLKQWIEYQTHPSFNWCLFPEAEASLDLIRIKKVRIGIQLQGSCYLTNKYVNYTRTTTIWTPDNQLVANITSPKHKLQKWEMDFGLYINW